MDNLKPPQKQEFSHYNESNDESDVSGLGGKDNIEKLAKEMPMLDRIILDPLK